MYMGLEGLVSWLYYENKHAAWEYLYLGGMRWDPLGRLEDDKVKSEQNDDDSIDDEFVF